MIFCRSDCCGFQDVERIHGLGSLSEYIFRFTPQVFEGIQFRAGNPQPLQRDPPSPSSNFPTQSSCDCCRRRATCRQDDRGNGNERVAETLEVRDALLATNQKQAMTGQAEQTKRDSLGIAAADHYLGRIASLGPSRPQRNNSSR